MPHSFWPRKVIKPWSGIYSTRSGEIDLVALHNGEVAFDVKTRTSDAYGAPELAVNPRKQLRMIKAALSYIKYKKLHQRPCRFDVVAISAAAENGVELIQNAFEMAGRTFSTEAVFWIVS